MSDVFDRAFEDAVRRLREASEIGNRALVELLYDLNPLTVFSRGMETGAELFAKARPPTPDQLVDALAKYGLAKPEDLAKALSIVLPTPKQIVEVVESAIDPTQKIERIGLGVGLPLAVLIGAVIVAIALALSR